MTEKRRVGGHRERVSTARQNAVLEAVNRILRETLTCDTEEQLGRACLAAAEELTQSKFGFIGEINPQGRLDDVAISDPGWAACEMQAKSGHREVPTSFDVRGLYGRVLQGGKGFFTNAPASHPDSRGLPGGHPPVEAFLGVPLIDSVKTIGMVALANREGGYDANDLAAVEALAPAVVQAFKHWRAERALRNSEEQYRSIVETAQEGVIIGRPDGRILFVNKKMADLLGYARDEIVGRVGLELAPDLDRDAVLHDRQALRDGGLVRGEYKFRRKDGTALWTLANVSPLRDGDGRHVANLAMHSDITDRKQSEQELRAALDRAAWLARLPGENPNPVLRVSARGIVLFRNPAAAQAPAWACEEGGPPPGPLLALVTRAVEQGKSLQQDVPLDGRCYSVTVAPFPDEQYANVYVDDVTVRVQAELALREAKDHLERRVQERTAALDQTNRALEGEIAERRRVEERVLAERQRLVDVLETLPVYVVLLAQDYHVPFANRFFRERFGESHGRRCFDYLFGRSEPCEVCETYTVLKTGAPHRWEWTGPDGRDYDIYDFPFKDTDGSQLIMEMGIDITARKHAEAELRSQQGHLEQLVEKRTAEIEHRNAQLVEEAAVRQRVEAELLRAKNEWERTFDSVPDLIAIIDNQHRISRMNRAMAKRLRRTPEECLGSHCYECVHGASHPPKVCPLTLTLMDRGEHVAEVHEESLGGDFIVSTTPLVGEDGEMVGSVHVARDITERKLAQAALQEAHDTLERRVRQRTEELAQVNQTLCMISDCNQALVRATTENELVQEICRIIQGQGRYRMAWVGYAERDAAKTVRAVAWAGLEQGYLEQARISWADDERGRGPTGTCIRTRRPCIGHDFLKDPNLAPWREQALAAGFRSSIALPLVADGQAFGALTLYAADVGVFGEQQITLLTELADDLAFGIMARRAALERDHARHVAEERARQLARLATELGRVEQRERQSLARVLHDHLQQLLVGAKYNLASVEGMLRSRFKQRAFREVTRILDEAIAAASSLTAELSPPALHERGLVAGLDWLSRQMRQKHGLRVEVHADHGAEPAGEQARLFLFQAVRELLFNVVKHAKVSCAQVDVARLDGDEVRVVVADDGVGFDPDSLEPGERTSGGFGLFSIRERLSCLGGRLSVDSRPGHGSRFTLVAPVFLPPCQAESSTSAAPPAVAPASGPARGARGDGSPKKPRSASGGRAQATARHPQRRLTKKRRKRA